MWQKGQYGHFDSKAWQLPSSLRTWPMHKAGLACGRMRDHVGQIHVRLATPPRTRERAALLSRGPQPPHSQLQIPEGPAEPEK